MDPTFVPTEPGGSTLADRPATPRRDGRRTVAAILGSAILAASLASATTAFVIEQAPPSGSASSGAATGILTTAMTGGTTSAASSAANGAPDTTVAAVAAVEPAVVTISTTAATGRSAGQVSGIGSGFIYASDGWILTNAHVVEGATSVTVTLADGRDLTGRVVTSDSTVDLAVVKVDATGLPTATLGSSSALVVGETVIAIGSPLGTYEGSATSGILSATNRSISVADQATRTDQDLTGLLQTDAAINPGNSGGPLIDLSGDVIGIVTAGSSSAEGIGFAIPINAAAPIMAQATSAAA